MTRKNGFTLIELSIVLVIIGLILGGIFVGQSLIRSSELRSVATEAGRYTQAIGDFRDKYFALPGDFAGSTALWGTTGGANVAGTGTQTFDGDGNGRITTQSTNTTYYEQFRAWQHLVNAGMIDGSYSGITATANTQQRIPGTNVPQSQLPGAGWGIVTILVSDISPIVGGPAGGGGTVTDIGYVAGDTAPNTVLWLGGQSISPYANNQMTPVLSANEALGIDQKLDDGMPNTGKIVAQINAAGTACYAGSSYSLAAGNICALVFKTGF